MLKELGAVLTVYTVYLCHSHGHSSLFLTLAHTHIFKSPHSHVLWFFFPVLGLFYFIVFPLIFYISHCCYSVFHHAGFGYNSDSAIHAVVSSLVALIFFIVVLSVCCLRWDVFGRPLGSCLPHTYYWLHLSPQWFLSSWYSAVFLLLSFLTVQIC